MRKTPEEVLQFNQAQSYITHFIDKNENTTRKRYLIFPVERALHPFSQIYLLFSHSYDDVYISNILIISTHILHNFFFYNLSLFKKCNVDYRKCE